MTLMTFAMQAQITGTVVDADSNDPLIGASVLIKGTAAGTITDVDGSFSINAENSEDCQLEIGYLGYQTVFIDVAGCNGDVGAVSVRQGYEGLEEVVITGVLDIVKDRRTPVAVSTISATEIQAKAVGNVEFPEIMKNTPSVYVSNQTGFGDAQMFMRGFSQTNTAFLLNGQPINGMEDGRMYWSNWSGMSDVASAVQIQRGLGSSKLAISSVGGTVNIVTKTTDSQKGGFVRTMVGNDGYLKGTVSYNTGLKNKWAFSVLLDHWQADNKWADGTRGQGQNYFMSLGFKPNDKHNFNLLITGAPQWHGNRWSQSLDKLNEEPKFNQHVGTDQGEWESERRNFYHKPVINLNWDFKINEKSSLGSVLYASFGRGGGTGPFGSSSNRVRTGSGQVDFDAIRANNVADDDGIGSFGGNYAIRSSMNSHQWFGNVTTYNTELSENVSLSVGGDLRFYTGDHYRQFANLLGLDGWSDNFRHATRTSDAVQSESFDANPWTALFNTADSDQRIGYDYSEQINYQGLFSQIEFANDKFTTFAQGSVSNQSYQREGRWADIGKSEKISKIGYNVKAGASYVINGSSSVFANAGLYSRQPFLDNIFTNVRYSNELVTTGGDNSVDNEDVVGFEVGYKFENNNFRLNLNGYSTQWGNRTIVNVFTNEAGTPEDESDDFTQRQVQRGLSQVHRGVELDLRYRIDDFVVKAFGSIGDWTYDGIETVQNFNDDTGEEISTISGLDNKGVHIPNAPQASVGLGLEYSIADFKVYADLNYFDKLYINNINFDSDNQILTEDIGTLDSYELLDLGASYNLKIGESNRLIFRVNVYNLLDKFYINQTDPFGYLNGNGRTWNTSAKYIF
jgi:outer membrane receptor protein involved in Fe transport